MDSIPEPLTDSNMQWKVPRERSCIDDDFVRISLVEREGKHGDVGNKHRLAVLLVPKRDCSDKPQVDERDDERGPEADAVAHITARAKARNDGIEEALRAARYILSKRFPGGQVTAKTACMPVHKCHPRKPTD